MNPVAPEEIERAWAAYRRQPTSIAARNRLVEIYYPIVKHLAKKMAKRLGNMVDVDDLESSGVFGLIDAIESFDPDRKNKFQTYCPLRIQGEMLDEIRRIDWVPRRIRSMARRFRQSLDRLTAALERQPTEEELARDMQLSIPELNEHAEAAHTVTVMSLDTTECVAPDGEACSLRELISARRSDMMGAIHRGELVRQIQNLVKPIEWEILRLYYLKAWTMHRIANRLGLCESRISQLHDRVIFRLRSRMDGMDDDAGESAE